MTQGVQAGATTEAAAKRQRRLERWKDRATIFSSLVAAGALAFAAGQFYLGRLALQSQTILAATNNAVQLQAEMLKNPDVYSAIYGMTLREFTENVAERQIIAFYVARYYERMAGVLPEDAWAPILSEICALKTLPKIAPLLSMPTQYPQGFVEILAACK